MDVVGATDTAVSRYRERAAYLVVCSLAKRNPIVSLIVFAEKFAKNVI